MKAGAPFSSLRRVLSPRLALVAFGAALVQSVRPQAVTADSSLLTVPVGPFGASDGASPRDWGMSHACRRLRLRNRRKGWVRH